MPTLSAGDIGALDVGVLAREIQSDLESDFVIAPHFSVVLKQEGEDFVQSVLRALQSGFGMPRPPIHVLVPKQRGHFRPGAILEPFDRVVYHAVSSLVFDTVGPLENDRTVSASYLTMRDHRDGGNSRFGAWGDYNERLVGLAGSSDFALVLDVAHYFERIRQHDLVNYLRAEGLSSNACNLVEELLSGLRMRDSHGILQGMLPSDLLGDLYLRRLDSFVERRGLSSVRFVDDVFVAGDSERELRKFYFEATDYLRGLGLQPNEHKTRIVSSDGFLREHTEIDDLFAAASREVAEELGAVTLSYGTGIAWDVDTVGLEAIELKATSRLLAEAVEGSADRHRILRFVLRPLASVGSEEALPLVLNQFESDAHMAREYARYLVRFANDERVVSAMTRILKSESVVPYQTMHALAVLMEADALPSGSVRTILDHYEGSGPDVTRALAAIAIGKFGDGSSRQDLMDSFQHASSDYLRCALVYSAQYLVQAQQRTAKRVWAPSSPLCSEIAARVL